MRDTEIDRYPARFGSPTAGRNPYGQLRNLIIVGATNGLGELAESVSQTSNYITTFAPGQSIYAPIDPSNANPWEKTQGTSFGESTLLLMNALRSTRYSPRLISRD